MSAMNEIRRTSTETQCAVCNRTLLMGERLVRYHRFGEDDALVCELCLDSADARGWVREGSPALPVQLGERREKGLRRWLRTKPPRHVTAPEPFDPELLPDDPRDAVEAGIELFNESTHPRTVSGIARTLGDPHVSVVQRSHREVVVTVAWELPGTSTGLTCWARRRSRCSTAATTSRKSTRASANGTPPPWSTAPSSSSRFSRRRCAGTCRSPAPGDGHV